MARADLTGPGWVAFDGERIARLGAGPVPAGAVDLGDVIPVPGLVDLQVNGIGDVDVRDASPGGWRRLGRELLLHGVTAWCPTLTTIPPERYRGALEAIAAAREDAARVGLPEILGAHLEGPFLAVPGAHPPGLLRRADPGWLAGLLDDLPGVVRMVTLSPEADPGLEATRLLASRGVVVGLGHSRCTYEEALAAADAGATVVTHAFDAMGPLHHRAPGLVGAALEDERLVPTLIGDLAHVHPAVIRLVAAAKARVALVSDAVATAGLVARDGAAFLPDGSLAGSATPLGVALGRVAAAGIPLARAVEMASTVPAGVLDLADRGHLAVGARADVVGLDPATLAVRAVWLRGERVARAPVEERGDG